MKKLELLTIADLASKKQVVPYAEIMKQLGNNDLRQIEDKIIDCIYSDLLNEYHSARNQDTLLRTLNEWPVDTR